MIPIIINPKLFKCILFCLTGSIAQFCYSFFEISLQFLLRYTADTDKAAVHRDVHKIVKVAKHAHLTKLSYTRKECKSDIFVLSFQYRVECLQLVTIVLLQFLIVKGLQNRFVVFVNKNHHIASFLLGSTLYNSLEA